MAHEIYLPDWITGPDMRQAVYAVLSGLIGWSAFNGACDYAGKTWGWHNFELLSAPIWLVSVALTVATYKLLSFVGAGHSKPEAHDTQDKPQRAPRAPRRQR